MECCWVTRVEAAFFENRHGGFYDGRQCWVCLGPSESMLDLPFAGMGIEPGSQLCCTAQETESRRTGRWHTDQNLGCEWGVKESEEEYLSDIAVSES